MDRFAQMPERDRRDVFTEAGAQRGIRPALIEKDFWVCLVLNKLFVESEFREHVVFKGGTSLSKVFGLINRFSEDIDIVLDWKLLGFTNPPPDFDSNTQRDKFNKEVNLLAAEFIGKSLRPSLDQLLKKVSPALSVSVDSDDHQVLNVQYPAALSEAYIRPEVRLEIGPLASSVPSAWHTIRPYSADVLPTVFDKSDCPVLAIAAERTFWEKATILHQEAHREQLIPQRYSRHYYDLCQLAQSTVRDRAIADLSLLQDVVQFKQRFYPSKWARYDLAMPGSFRLLPPSDEHVKQLQADYRDMQVMLFGSPPTFDQITSVLTDLEKQINTLPSPHP